MKARPIICRAPMVRAILAGVATQMRCVIKPQPAVSYCTKCKKNADVCDCEFISDTQANRCTKLATADLTCCPYGQPGDRLWVRESFRLLDVFDGDSPNTVADRCLNAGYPKPWAPTHYEADGWRDNWQHVGTPPHQGGPPVAGKLRPGIHMPRWASRITLEIVAVRVERLNDISEADAAAEGIEPMFLGDTDEMKRLGARVAFKSLWESINGAGSWEANPWVWVIEFRRTPHG